MLRLYLRGRNCQQVLKKRIDWLQEFLYVFNGCNHLEIVPQKKDKKSFIFVNYSWPDCAVPFNNTYYIAANELGRTVIRKSQGTVNELKPFQLVPLNS